MADTGYSSEYEVYLTKENGVQIVINRLSLSILKVLRRRELSPSEIATSLDIPKSTIQGNINKLIRTGIVSQDVRIDDTRSVVYHICAIPLFSSESDIGWQLSARSASVTRIMKVGKCTSAEDISLYGVSLTESGLNIVQGLLNVGAALVRGKDDVGWWKDMFGRIDEQSGKHGIHVQMDVKDGLRLRFESDTEDISDMPMVVVPMIGALVSKSRTVLGYRLAHEATLQTSNNGLCIEIHVPPFEGQDYEGINTLPKNRSTFAIEEQFSLYSIDRKAVLFTNPTMMAILDRLTESESSLNELESGTGLSKATVYTALSKLIDLGAVKADKLPGQTMKYSLNADPILYTTKEAERDFEKMDEIIQNFHAGRLDYYSAVISFAMMATSCMGIHFNKMFTRAGKNAAMTVLETKPDIKPQEFVDMSCSMVSEPDSIEIETYIPLCFRITLSEDSLWGSWPVDFMVGFLSEGLKHLIGNNFRTTIKVMNKGDPEPSSILEF